jgi:uncharacterized protein
MKMNKKNAYITGSSSGIGKAFAKKLAKSHNLVLIARNETKLQVIAASLSQTTNVEIIVSDLSNSEGIEMVKHKLIEDPNFDLLINNAAYASMGRFGDQEIDKEVNQIQLNVLSVVHLSHAAIKNLTSRNATGGIINVASIVGLIPTPTSSIYGASKAFVKSFSESLYEEYYKDGIIIQALCPGFTRTNFQDNAGFNKEPIPDFVWMESEDVVNESIQSYEKKEAVCIPGVLNRSIATVLDIIPRELIRRITGVVVKPKDEMED